MSSSYQKYCLFFFLLMTFSFTSAQTIEEEIAKKSCECIQSRLSPEGTISSPEIKKCVSKSSDEVLRSKDPQEVKRITKNMEEVVERLKTVYQLVQKCLPKQDD
ncbi:MAG: hypothetical protein E2590_12200 [Chryseobacterium sp.]|nr:hypothetical protein [Chryseobacterium sp.]